MVAREKASNEAKSEFMSLMCHEVRTPLNGCLASAEMLLETDLNVREGTRAGEYSVGSGLCGCIWRAGKGIAWGRRLAAGWRTCLGVRC